jgi:hypothetical protein
MNSYYLNFEFTLSFWVRPDDLATVQTLYAADVDDTANNGAGSRYTYFYIEILTDGTVKFGMTAEGDLSSPVEDTFTSTATANALAWNSIAVTSDVADDATISTITISVNGTSLSQAGGSETSFVFIDRTSNNVFVGASRNSGDGTPENHFGGMIYQMSV